MARGITPKAQPLGTRINKIWRGCFCDEYGVFIINAPVKLEYRTTTASNSNITSSVDSESLG